MVTHLCLEELEEPVQQLNSLHHAIAVQYAIVNLWLPRYRICVCTTMVSWDARLHQQL